MQISCDWQPSLDLIFGILPSSWISLFSVHTAGYLISISFELIPLSQRAFSNQLKRTLFPTLSHPVFKFFYLFAYCYIIFPAKMEAPKGKRLFSSHFPLPNKVHYMKRHIFIFHLKCDLFWWLLCGCWAVYLDTMIFLRWVLICTLVCSYIYNSFSCLLKKLVYRFPCRLSIVNISCNNIRDYFYVVPIYKDLNLPFLQ